MVRRNGSVKVDGQKNLIVKVKGSKIPKLAVKKFENIKVSGLELLVNTHGSNSP